MILGIICLLFFTIIIIYIYKTEGDSLDESLGIFGISLFLCVAISFCSILTFNASCKIYNYLDSETEIYSINSETGIDGNFFLGSGTIESCIYYFYYVKGDDGGIVIEKVKSDDVEIIETYGIYDMGYTKKYLQKTDNNFLSWFFGIGETILFQRSKIKIYVPEGTIKYQFDISV